MPTLSNAVLLTLFSVLPLYTAGQRTFLNTKFDLSSNLPVNSGSESIATITHNASSRGISDAVTNKAIKVPVIPKLAELGSTTEKPISFIFNNVQSPSTFVFNNKKLIKQKISTDEKISSPKFTLFKKFNATPVVQSKTHTDALSKLTNFTAPSSWYQENYNVTECANDLEKLSVEFKKKFPKKISKTGEDMRIAEVIMNRLAECQKKVKRGHWEEVDEVLSKLLTISKSKILECQNALVEEHIACTNLLSFACQFAKPEFQFRLLPAKLIISEARSAKTAAEVCRAITKEAKQRLDVETD